MGQLVDYFRHLKKKSVIDQDIINTLTQHAYPISRQNDWSFYEGVHNHSYDFTCLPWAENYISHTRLRYAHYDFISARFSGCYMARYEHNGYRYGCHIHTGAKDKKRTWNSFIANNQITNCVLFRPDSALIMPFHGNDAWGIISHDDNRCYTVVVNVLQQNINQLICTFLNIKKETTIPMSLPLPIIPLNNAQLFPNLS